MSVNLSRSRPSLGRTQDDHWPPGEFGQPSATRFLLNRFDLFHAPIQSRCHCLVHAVVLRTLDKIRFVSVAFEQIFKIFMADARKNSWIVNFIPVEVQNWQDGAVGDWIEKLIGVP